MSNRFPALICLVLFGAGCGGGTPTPMTPAEQKESDLLQVGEMYRNFVLAKGKAPQKFADLISVRAVSGNGYAAVQSGDVVLRYGANMTDTREEPGTGDSDEVLAYEKQVPASGGKVLMLNRAIRSMTAGEFKSAKLAGTTSSADAAAKQKSKGSGKSKS